MRAIRAEGNKSTEVRFRLALVRAQLKGWKLRPKGLPGKPDFYFPAQRVAVFVDGCFWHGCPDCRSGRVLKTNTPYWSAKIQRNRERDREHAEALANVGIRVFRVWEHELNAPSAPIHRLVAVLEATGGGQASARTCEVEKARMGDGGTSAPPRESLKRAESASSVTAALAQRT